MARAHSHGGVACSFPTRKACDLARKAALGQCSEMVQAKGKGDPYPCPHWAVEKVGYRGYCGQHINSVILAADEMQRRIKAGEALEKRISAYLTWRIDHPSVWDRMEEI